MTKNPPQSPFKKGGKYEIATATATKGLLAMTRMTLILLNLGVTFLCIQNWR
jgi:hypothetical protein